MDADSQARGGRGGRSGGVPNYRNDILIYVVEEYLPQGLEGWRGVALAYQREYGGDSSSGGGPSGQLEQEALQPHAEADR